MSPKLPCCTECGSVVECEECARHFEEEQARAEWEAQCEDERARAEAEEEKPAVAP